MLKVGTLCWIIPPAVMHLGKVAQITAPLAWRNAIDPAGTRAQCWAYEARFAGEVWVCIPDVLLPFSDPDIARPEAQPATREVVQ